MAMAAKAKLLLRELKTVKADLAFAKERCGQLEEENRVIRESSAEGGSPEDDDLVCISLPDYKFLFLFLCIFLVLHTSSHFLCVHNIFKKSISPFCVYTWWIDCWIL